DQLLTTVDLREILRIKEQRVAVVADRADAVNEINRNTLQWLLSTDLDDVIHYGKVLQRYEHLDDGTVRCHFADGTSVTADFVVGADGGESQVRKQLLPHARRVNTGLFIVAGKYVLNEETAKALPPALTAGMVGVMPLRGYSMASAPIRQSRHGGVNDETYDHNPALFDNASDHILWSYNASARRYPHDVSELDADGLKQLVGGLIADWHPGLGAAATRGRRGHSQVGRRRRRAGALPLRPKSEAGARRTGVPVGDFDSPSA
ncbi:FAD-dependent monooxygenase, partial [Kibdelosporangium lantanae]